jgi:hypothetical protein
MPSTSLAPFASACSTRSLPSRARDYRHASDIPVVYTQGIREARRFRGNKRLGWEAKATGDGCGFQQATTLGFLRRKRKFFAEKLSPPFRGVTGNLSISQLGPKLFFRIRMIRSRPKPVVVPAGRAAHGSEGDFPVCKHLIQRRGGDRRYDEIRGQNR